MATLLRSKKAGIVGVIIDVIVAAIFILMAATFISDVLGGFVSCTGQIEDASKVVCLGNGDGKVVCVDKDSGVEKFSCEAGSKWQARTAASPPKLEWQAPAEEGGLATGNIFFGLGDHFCAYDWKGENIWGFNGCADLSDAAIPTSSDINSDVVCFGNGASHTAYCLGKKTSEVKLKVHSDPDWGFVDAKSTPALSKEGNTNYAYFGLGNRVCKYDVAKGDAKDAPNQAEWCNSYKHTTVTGISSGTDSNYYCFGSGDEPAGTAEWAVHCLNPDGSYGYKFTGSWSDCPAAITKGDSSSTYNVNAECKTSATPIISGNYIYVPLGNRICKYNINDPQLALGIKQNGEGAVWCTKISSQSFELKFKPPYDQIVHWNSGYVSGDDGKRFIYGEVKGVIVSGGFICTATDLEIVCFNNNDATPVFTGHILGLDVGRHPDLKVTCSRDACKSMGQPVLSGGNLYFALGDLLCSYPTSVFAAGKQVEISNEDDKSDGRNWCVDVSDKQIQTGVAAAPELEIIETGPASVQTKAGSASVDIYATTNIPAKCKYSDEGKIEYSDMPAITEKTANAVHSWPAGSLAVGSYSYNFACASDVTPNIAKGTLTVVVSQQVCQTDLSMSNPRIFYQDGTQANLADFQINKKFKAYIDLKSTSQDCTGPADVHLYGKTPTTNEMEIVVNPPPWTDKNADTTLAYPQAFGVYAQLPNNGAGTYTLKFSLAIDAAKVKDTEASNNEYLIQMVVK
ncbi:MAG: hypothetical protein HYT16_01910 [DPANN group archaeon]|nr:hypothetical protein [DPANN group archaeon]